MSSRRRTSSKYRFRAATSSPKLTHSEREWEQKSVMSGTSISSMRKALKTY